MSETDDKTRVPGLALSQKMGKGLEGQLVIRAFSQAGDKVRQLHGCEG